MVEVAYNWDLSSLSRQAKLHVLPRRWPVGNVGGCFPCSKEVAIKVLKRNSDAEICRCVCCVESSVSYKTDKLRGGEPNVSEVPWISYLPGSIALLRVHMHMIHMYTYIYICICI